MVRFWIPKLFCLAAILVMAPATRLTAAPPLLGESEREWLQKTVASAEQNRQPVIQGREGWLFFTPEIRSVLAGEFWGDRAALVSRASQQAYADPLPAILDFHERLSDVGIELLFVPVPAKAAVYPERLVDGIRASDADSRLDANHAAFLRLLTQSGVDVLDLLPIFQAHPDTQSDPLYCRTDTHWSGSGVILAADAIAKHLQQRDWLRRNEQPRPQPRPLLQTQTIHFQGDLAAMLPDADVQRESLTITTVRDDQGQLIEPAKTSAVLLLGDSHTLVFHDPTLHASGAGLPDHLAAEFGFAVDLIGVRGSGATAARISLARQKNRLAGKRLVIWCFAARDFTETLDGWRKLPLPAME